MKKNNHNKFNKTINPSGAEPPLGWWKFKKNRYFVPLVSVPSTYSKVYEKDLIKNGFKIVIYANHLLRAAYPAMNHVAKKILENGRAFEIEKKIILSSLDKTLQ